MKSTVNSCFAKRTSSYHIAL